MHNEYKQALSNGLLIVCLVLCYFHGRFKLVKIAKVSVVRKEFINSALSFVQRGQIPDRIVADSSQLFVRENRSERVR